MGSISGWMEAIILSLVFAGCLALVVASFNVMYSKNNATPFTDNSGSQQLFIDYQGTAQTQLEGGEVSFDAANGIQIKSGWGLALDMVKIAWGFISGGWIETTISSMKLGEAGTLLSVGLRILYFISLVAALLYAIFKVVF